MSDIHHTQLIKTIYNSIKASKKANVVFLENKTTSWNGQQLNIGGQDLINFGTCGYLGLETDRRLIERSMAYTDKFGTQFSISRTAIISDLVTKLETQLGEVFGERKVLVFSSTTLAHSCVLPTIIQPGDAIILDKQVHLSVNSGSQSIPTTVIPRVTIRHNDMDMLENTIKRFKDKHNKIWFLADGVYSMFGDFLPTDAINALMSKYEQLHLYVDDAHGMAWAGTNGSGVIFDKIQHKDRLVLSTTMAKGFGSVGGVVVFPDKELFSKVQIFGGALSYSHPLPPSILGASTATTDILLSPEIYTLQQELQEKIAYCNQLLATSNLPIPSNPMSPIKFVGIGQSETGYKIHNRIIKSGFYVSLTIFPTVPLNKIGLRFTITRHATKEHIKQLIDTIQYHYHQVMKEEAVEIGTVRKLFKLPTAS